MSSTILGPDSLKLPSGTTAERPSSPNVGDLRFNTETGNTEFYDGTNWAVIGTG